MPHSRACVLMLHITEKRNMYILGINHAVFFVDLDVFEVALQNLTRQRSSEGERYDRELLCI